MKGKTSLKEYKDWKKLQSKEFKEKPKKNQYYIARRDNPQLNEPYYLLVGELTEQEVIKRSESVLYGTLTYIPYKTREEYNEAIMELKLNRYNIR